MILPDDAVSWRQAVLALLGRILGCRCLLTDITCWIDDAPLARMHFRPMGARIVAKASNIKTNPIDKHVGSRVRMRRLMLDISQEQLGDALGVTFQQVQKYEKGANRISASRLQRISAVLKVPIPFFFEGTPDNGVNGGAEIPEDVTGFLATADGIALARAFTLIKKPKLRRCIVDMVMGLAGREDD